MNAIPSRRQCSIKRFSITMGLYMTLLWRKTISCISVAMENAFGGLIADAIKFLFLKQKRSFGRGTDVVKQVLKVWTKWKMCRTASRSGFSIISDELIMPRNEIHFHTFWKIIHLFWKKIKTYIEAISKYTIFKRSKKAAWWRNAFCHWWYQQIH